MREYWKQRAETLKWESLRDFFSIEDEFIRRLLLENIVKPMDDYKLGEFVHLALYREMIRDSACSDCGYIDEFVAGLWIIGMVQRSGRWPEIWPVPSPKLTERDLQQRAWEIQDRFTMNRGFTRSLLKSQGV